VLVTDGRRLTAIRSVGPDGKPAGSTSRADRCGVSSCKSPLPFEPRVTSRFSLSAPAPGARRESRASRRGLRRAGSAPPCDRRVAAWSRSPAGPAKPAAWSDPPQPAATRRRTCIFVVQPGHSAWRARSQGDLIGRVGASGTVTGPHLDYRIIKNGTYVNPLIELKQMPQGRADRRRRARAFARRATTTSRAERRVAADGLRKRRRGCRPRQIIVLMSSCRHSGRCGPCRTALRVASVPYDVVNTDEARALASGNPLSFLHVTAPEIDLPAGTNPYDGAVYEQAGRNLRGSKRAAPLVHRDEPSLYLYRLKMGSHSQIGVAGCFSLDEYEGGLDQEAREDAQGQRGRSHAHMHRACARRPASCS
jgi:hypothetical protein